MIEILFIEHGCQRYPTVGDWMDGNGTDLKICVSRTGDHRMDMLIAVHELVEALLCRFRAIPQELVDQFDLHFKGDGEPGDDPGCPYRREHFTATIIEMIMARELHVDWQRYEQRIDELMEAPNGDETNPRIGE